LDLCLYVLQAHVALVCESDANTLPTGRRTDLPAQLDFRQPRPIGGTSLDHVLTGVTAKRPSPAGLIELAVLSHPQAFGRLRILTDIAFRELVLFTPAHRQAIAIEPYTCSADAANLAGRGIDSGWQVLAPGETWQARVEYQWESGPSSAGA